MHGFVLLAFVVSLFAPTAADATEFLVTKTADTLDGACDTDCSLREAVLAANSGPGHVITIPAGVYRLTRVPGGSDPENGTAGSLFVDRPVTINGAGKDDTIIDARPTQGQQGIDRVMLVSTFGSPTITGVTFRGGYVAQSSPRTLSNGSGGGIYMQRGTNSSLVTFTDCAITDNVATLSGGGLSVHKFISGSGTDADVMLVRTDVTDNAATDPILGQGGGIWNGDTNVHIVDSTIAGNTASVTGGGIHVSVGQSQRDAHLVMNGSTISNNIAGLDGDGGSPAGGANGGGIYNTKGNFELENCTIVGNEARPGLLPFPTGWGGGIYNLPESGNPKTAQLINTTVAYNEAQVGSQLFSTVFGDSNGLLVGNTLIVGAPGGDPNCPTTSQGIGVVSLGGNVSSDTSLCNLNPAQLGDQVGVTDTGLAAALADNGGETMTLAVSDDSVVVGAGVAVLLCPSTDQRGVSRPVPCTVGAYEPSDETAITCGDASEVSASIGVGVVVPGGAERLITASDALIVLTAAVGFTSCPTCVCDVDSSGSITATDALAVLKAAVGQSITLTCPACT